MHPESKYRLLKHNLLELPVDINGELDGAAYKPFLQVKDLRSVLSVRKVIPGIWTGRGIHVASLGEEEWVIVNEGRPENLSIREGYVMATGESIDRVMAGERPPRRDFWTLDFVLTQAARNMFGPLRYHGVSLKPPSLQVTEAAKRRSEREMQDCALIGWTWSYAKQPTSIEVANHRKLREWAKAYPIDDAFEEAQQIASLYNKTTSEKSLRACLKVFARRLGFAETDSFFVLAAAYYFGFIGIDHRFVMDEDRPLVIDGASHKGGYGDWR